MKQILAISVLLAALASFASHAEKAALILSPSISTASGHGKTEQFLTGVGWPASTQGGECSTGSTAQTGGCIAYEHRGFDGMRQDLGPNRIFNYVGSRMNDEISSFRVSSGCRVVVWEHRDKGGASAVFGECSYIGERWNDRISSWKCECRR